MNFSLVAGYFTWQGAAYVAEHGRTVSAGTQALKRGDLLPDGTIGQVMGAAEDIGRWLESVAPHARVMANAYEVDLYRDAAERLKEVADKDQAESQTLKTKADEAQASLDKAEVALVAAEGQGPEEAKAAAAQVVEAGAARDAATEKADAAATTAVESRATADKAAQDAAAKAPQAAPAAQGSPPTAAERAASTKSSVGRQYNGSAAGGCGAACNWHESTVRRNAPGTGSSDRAGGSKRQFPASSASRDQHRARRYG